MQGMSYDAMQACNDKMNREYRAGRTDRPVWVVGVEALHRSYARSNGYTACVCFVCREVRQAKASKGII